MRARSLYQSTPLIQKKCGKTAGGAPWRAKAPQALRVQTDGYETAFASSCAKYESRTVSGSPAQGRAETGQRPRGAISHGSGYLRFGLDYPGLYKAMFASHLLPQVRDGVALQATASGSVALLVDATAAPDPERAQRIALRIWASLHGIVMLQNQGMLQNRLVPIKLEQLVDDVRPPIGAGTTEP